MNYLLLNELSIAIGSGVVITVSKHEQRHEVRP